MKRLFIWLMTVLLVIGYVCCAVHASDGEQTDDNPFAMIGGWFADRGKDIENAANATGEAITNAAAATGEALTNAAVATGDAITNAAVVTGEAVTNAAVATGDAVTNAAVVTGDALTNAAIATGDAVTNAATVTGDAITNAAIATGDAVTNAATVTGDAITNAATVTGEWIGDRAIDVGNAAVETGELAVLAVQNADPSKLLDKQYYLDSLEKTALGDYSDKDPTFLSIGLNLAASVANVDAPMDIRDLSYDFRNLDSEDVTAGRIALDAVGLLPLIGGLKYIKHIDTIADGARAAGKAADAASDLKKTLNTVADVADTVHDAAKTADAIDAVHDAAKVADVLDDVHDTAKAADIVDDVHDAAKTADVIDDVHDTAKAADVVDDVNDTAKVADGADDVHDAAKTADVADEVKEVSKSTDSVDGIKDTSKAAQKTDEVKESAATVDIASSTKKVGDSIDKSLIPGYLEEVSRITKRELNPVQLKKLNEMIDAQDFVKLDPPKTDLNRKLFNNAKDKLIDEWEKNTGAIWPRYEEDIINKAGKIIRKKGDRYDAHHLIEISFGGPNAWWNLHPASIEEHNNLHHAVDSIAKQLF